MGEVALSGEQNWVEKMASFLGCEVLVTLNRDDVNAVARGELLSFSEDGSVVVVDETGIKHHCWPNLITELVEEEVTPNVLWGVYKNTDMTEGRGREYLDRLFHTEHRAKKWVQTQSDYPGWPMHKIRPVQFDLSKLESFEGLMLPR